MSATSRSEECHCTIHMSRLLDLPNLRALEKTTRGSRRRRLPIILALLQLTTTTLAAQHVDTTYTRLIRDYTSDPKFLPASWATIEAHPTVPSPLKHFGTAIGAPGVMHRVSDILGYYRALAAASPRVQVRKIGTTEEGRDLSLVIISSDATMRDIDRP